MSKLAIVSLFLATAMFVSTSPAAAVLVDAPQGEPEADIIPDQLIVAFYDAVPADVDQWLAAHGAVVTMRDDVLHWVNADFETAAQADAFREVAIGRDDVRAVDYNGIARVMLVPNDPLYGQQWGWAPIRAPQAWDTQMGARAVKVAILDTGISFGHPDLAGAICGPHASFVGGEIPGVDGFGHGTHVGGTVAAVTNNGLGVSGTSQSCLMDVKVLSRWGGGSWEGVAAGIRWAADNGAHIISMSLGGGQPPTVMQDAVRYAYTAKGVLVVSAAGNSGCWGGNSVIWPARYVESMAVASLAAPGSFPSGFSSCGPNVEIAAPGSSVLSTVPLCSEAWAICSNSRYGYASGTSMATPHVSGVAALVKSQWPTVTAQELRCTLDLSADDIMMPGKDDRTGAGRVNAERAILPPPAYVNPSASLVGALSLCLTGN